MSIPTIIFEDGQEMIFSGSERITIGRAEDNNVIVDDPSISLHHGEIILHPDGAAEVRDRGSRTGTFVNGQRVDSHMLQSGDRLAFGPLSAVFRLKRTSPSTATTRIPLRAPDHATRDAQATMETIKAQVGEFGQIHAQSAPVENRLLGLKDDADALQSRLRVLQQDAEQAEKRLESLNADIVEAESRSRALKVEVDQSQERLKTLHDELRLAQKHFDAVTSDANKAQNRLGALIGESTAAQARLDLLREEEAKMGGRLEALKADEQAAKARLEQIRAQANFETARLETAQRECAEVEARTQKLLSHASRCQAEAREAEESLALLQKAAAKTEEVIGVLHGQQAEKTAVLAGLEKSVSEARARADAARQELSRLEVGVEEARARAMKQQDEARRAEEALATLQKAAAQMEMWQKERQEALDELAAQIAQKTASLQNLASEAAEARNRIEQLASRESEVGASLREIEDRAAQRQKQAEAAALAVEAEVQSQREELARVRAQLDGARASLDDVGANQSMLTSLAEERGRLETALRGLKRDLTTVEEQLTSARRKLASENALLEDARSQRADAESELKEIREQASVLTQDGTHAIKPKSSRSMIVVRLLLLLFPVGVLALAWWAAGQARRAHLLRSAGVVAMLATDKPALHPYAPATEVERQIIDLVHEPLMRIGVDGALTPALAELWRWSQDVTCWFADENTAKQAQERLQAQIGEKNRWAEWQLSTVRLVSNMLVLNFNDPTRAGTAQAFEVIADLKPQTIAFWRIETQVPVKTAAKRFMAESALAPQIRRVWFDHDNAFEIVVVGPSQKLLDELRSFIASRTSSDVRMELMGEVGALSEPVLDLDMRQGQSWHDGTPVTAMDVKTTIEQVSRRPWLLPNREALRHIQEMDIQNGGNRLRVVFRSRYGPALCGWAGLPVLPASWWKAHQKDDDLAFVDHPPPGAGAYRLQHLDARTLSLMPVARAAESPRFLFHFNASPLMTEIGLGTKTAHLLWPAGAHDGRHDLLPCLTPPHRRLVVLWNTKSSVLSDVRTREAAAMITDVRALIAALPGKHTVSDASLFPPGMWLHSKAARPPHDAAQAHKLLADAQWLPGVDGIARRAGQKLEFSLLVAEGDPVNTATARILAAQWKALGAQVQVERLASSDALAQRLAERKFDAVLVQQRFEVSWDQFPWWHSSQSKPGGTNFAGVEDPQTDLLLEALATEFEPGSAAERVRQLEARLLSQQPMLTLFDTVDDAAVSATLVGNKPRTSWTLRQIAFKDKKPARAPASFELKLPDE